MRTDKEDLLRLCYNVRSLRDIEEVESARAAYRAAHGDDPDVLEIGAFLSRMRDIYEAESVPVP